MEKQELQGRGSFEAAELDGKKQGKRRSPAALRRGLRFACRALAMTYLLVLTLFLVHPDAFSLFGAGAKSVEGDVDATVPGILQHMGAYGLLGVLLYAGFAGSRGSANWLLVLTMLHGLTTELIQAVVPNRTCDVWDLLANVSGAGISVIACAGIVKTSGRRILSVGVCALLVMFGGCSRGAVTSAETAITQTRPVARFVRSIDWRDDGAWIKVETHCHTTFSDGAHSIEEVVAKASEHGCHAVAITDHIDRLDVDNIPLYCDAIHLARRQFPDLLVLTGLEWNVPPSGGDDHVTVLFPEHMEDAATLIEFCETFDDYDREVHDPALALAGLNWLEQRADGVLPVASLNHPSRKFDDSAEVYDFFLEVAGSSRMLIGFSGAPGHQAGRLNGAYEGPVSTVDRWDPVVLPGNTWDRLLQSERDVWGALAPCDFHRHGGDDWGDYWPGEFSETWVYVPEQTISGVLRGLRGGAFFANHGGIVREATFSLEVDGLDKPGRAGEAIEVPQGTLLHLRLEAVVPATDRFGEPNQLDEVEFITVTEAGVETASYTPLQGEILVTDHRLTLQSDSLAVRVRGRRRTDKGADLMFYTNPIRVTTSK